MAKIQFSSVELDRYDPASFENAFKGAFKQRVNDELGAQAVAGRMVRLLRRLAC